MPSLSPLAVYCGSSDGHDPAFPAAARALGAALARRGIDLVYGGGRAGLMGHVADAALAGGGHVIGVITRQLVDMETAHTGLKDLRIVESMHERKMIMARTARAFIALPGGVGTLDEFFEIIAWRQLGLHQSPIGVLNVNGYYDPLLALLKHMKRAGFVRLDLSQCLAVRAEAGQLVDALEALEAMAG